MQDEIVGKALREGLDPAVVEALAETAALHRREYDLDRWLVNGRSRAPVAIVLETDHREPGTRRILLKVPIIEEEGPTRTEYARHQRAYGEAPTEFAKAHLTELARDPIRIGKGHWIVFQEIAGDDVESVEVPTVLLNTLLDDTPSEIDCSAETFARICGEVVSGVLEAWNGRPRTAKKPFTVAEFLGLHILDQLEPGGRLHLLSVEHAADSIEIPGEDGPLVNPFALARGSLFGDQRIVRGLVGRTHGDLHTDNILVRVRPEIDTADFYLIDLALYEAEDPLTRDPAHLLLYILARRMDALSPMQRNALLKYLVPDHRDRSQNRARHRSSLPNWLTDVVDAIDRAFDAWLEGSGLHPEYRRERLLSLAGCAMLFLGRKSTRPEDHEWFLRLAARAADQFVAMPGLPQPTAGAAVPPAKRPLDWCSLPEPLAVTWFSDLVRHRTVARAVLELHLVPAPPGERPSAVRLAALKQELVGIGTAARLFAEDEEPGTEDPATVTGRSGAGLAVTRGGQRSAWTFLPFDDLGAILDPDDLAARLRTLLDALLRVEAPRPEGFGLAVGVSASHTLSEGRVADLPRSTARMRMSMAPLRVPADDVLPLHQLSRQGSAVADELVERLLLDFRQEGR